MKLYLLYFFLLFSIKSYSQQDSATYEKSTVVDLPERGWNKVLMMPNGNTVLFHLEPRKGIIVKIFDKQRKEIASRKHICKVLDINTLDNSVVDGVYNINGEAVLFIEQSVFNKETLIKLRIDASSAALIEEKIIAQSARMDDHAQFRVFKDHDSNSYNVFCFSDVINYPKEDIKLLHFDANNVMAKEYKINVDKKKYRYVHLVNIEMKHGVVCAVLHLANVAIAGVYNPKYDRYLSINYLSQGADSFMATTVKLPKDIFPIATISSYNPNVNTLNMIVLNSRRLFYYGGLNAGVQFDMSSLLLTMNEKTKKIYYHWLGYKTINNFLQKQDSNFKYFGIPIAINTTNSGNINVISEGYSIYTNRYRKLGTPATFLGDFGVTQCNSVGDEVGGMVFPNTQNLLAFMLPSEIIYRNDFYALFEYSIPLDYQNQFVSMNYYTYDDKGGYIIFNDLTSNFNNSVQAPGKPIYEQVDENAYEYTDAFYYKINATGAKKHFLYKVADSNEYNSTMLGSADFDKTTQTYASVMIDRKGKKNTMYVTWCHLN